MRTTSTTKTKTAARWGLLVVPLAVAAGLALGACGDDEPEGLSEAEWTDRANAVCTEVGSDMEEELAPLFSGEPSPQDFEAGYAVLLDAGRRMTSEIRDLDEPEELTEDVDAWLDGFDARTDELEDADPAEVFATEEDPWSELNDEAADLGLDACAQS
jgi:hypothetical protein